LAWGYAVTDTEWFKLVARWHHWQTDRQ